MRLRQRDEPAAEAEFVAFYQGLHSQGYQVAFRLLGEAAAAEDATVEGFARAYSRWSHVRHLPYAEAWVIKVISNVALDALRRRKVPLADRWTGTDEDAIATRMTLVAALQQLPRQREVLVLHHLAGYQERDVAVVLGISPGTVKVHLRRGMAALRRDFRDDSGVVPVVD